MSSASGATWATRWRASGRARKPAGSILAPRPAAPDGSRMSSCVHLTFAFPPASSQGEGQGDRAQPGDVLPTDAVVADLAQSAATGRGATAQYDRVR